MRLSFQAATAPGPDRFLHTSNLALPHVLAAARSVRGPLPVDSVWGQTASNRYRSEATTNAKRVRLLHSGLTPSAIELQMGSGYHLVA